MFIPEDHAMGYLDDQSDRNSIFAQQPTSSRRSQVDAQRQVRAGMLRQSHAQEQYYKLGDMLVFHRVKGHHAGPGGHWFGPAKVLAQEGSKRGGVPG